jgi:multidrug efflux system membrane fusion protein
LDVDNKTQSWIGQHKVRASFLGAAVVLAGAFIVFSVGGSRSSAADKKGKGGPQTVAIEALPAARADVSVTIEGLGTVQAFNTVTVTTRVDGALQKLGFVEGQLVHKGDLLAQIDPRPFQAALGQADAAKAKDQAQLASAKADLERYTMLAPQNLASQQTVDTSKAQVSSLEAQIKGDQANIDNARTQLEYSTITSPIEGRTGIRKVDVGNNIHAADTTGIVVVTQVQPITVIFTLPEEVLPQINQSMAAGEVQVVAVSRDEKTELDHGTLQLVDNQIDPATGTIRLKAVFPNKQSSLWPGQYLNARVLLRTVQNALTIPSLAVQRGANGLFTYVVKPDSTVEARPLKVGRDDGKVAIIEGGLNEGERVATSNYYRLEPGVHVRIVQPAATGTEVAANTGPSKRKGAGNP